MHEYETKNSVYIKLEDSVSKLLKEIFEESGIKIEGIKSRIKTKTSLKDKIIRKLKDPEIKNPYKNLDSITDILGIRIVVFFAEDIHKVIEMLNKELVEDKEHSNSRNYEFDRFGYLSEHQIVEFGYDRLQQTEYKKYKNIKFEVQIRTVLQDVWAEINHSLEYKSKNILTYEKKRMLRRLAATLELLDDTFKDFKDTNKLILTHTDLFNFTSDNKNIAILDQIAMKYNAGETVNWKFDYILKILKLLNFNSLDNLSIEIANNHDTLEIFIDQMSTYGISFKYYEGISIAYFCIMYARKILDKDEFIKRFRTAEIYTNDEVEIFYNIVDKCYVRTLFIITSK